MTRSEVYDVCLACREWRLRPYRQARGGHRVRCDCGLMMKRVKSDDFWSLVIALADANRQLEEIR